VRLLIPSIKPSVLKTFDRFVGKLVINLFPSPPAVRLQREIASILIIRPGGIGDAALLAPTIYALQHAHPGARIKILAEKRNGSVFSLVPGIDRVFLYDSPAGLKNALQESYDLVIDTEQWHRLSALIARMTGAPVLIGFDTNERRRMFTHTVPYSHEEYEADSFLHLLTPLEIYDARDEAAQFLFPPENARHQVRQLLSPLENQPFITIFPGASIKERRWGSDRFRQVVESLEAHGVTAVIVGSNDDRKTGEEIVGNSRAINLAGLTTLACTAAAIASSRLLLSGDSGVLHIGVGVGVTTISLFGPGIAAKWAPRGKQHTILDKQLPCSPCTRFGTTPPCPRGITCLAEITPQEVTSAILNQLKEPGT
jgi:ADP-heptose:LPS heptosyltransferase